MYRFLLTGQGPRCSTKISLKAFPFVFLNLYTLLYILFSAEEQQKQPLEVFCKKRCEICIFIEKRPWNECFPVNFEKFHLFYRTQAWLVSVCSGRCNRILALFIFLLILLFICFMLLLLLFNIFLVFFFAYYLFDSFFCCYCYCCLTVFSVIINLLLVSMLLFNFYL